MAEEFYLIQKGRVGCLAALFKVAYGHVSRRHLLDVLLYSSVWQALSHLGFLKLDYAKMQAYFTDALDVNRDGKVDGRDLRTLFDRAVQVWGLGCLVLLPHH